MRQIWIPKTGEPEVLELRESFDPKPNPGEVRIRVHASGINFADILARMGLYPDSPELPAVVGYEVAGVIDGVGEGVEGFRDGDRVLAFTRFGGYSDVVCQGAGLRGAHPGEPRLCRCGVHPGQLDHGMDHVGAAWKRPRG